MINKLSLLDQSDYDNCFEYQNEICNTIIGESLYTIVDADISVDGITKKEAYISIILPDDIRGDIFISVNDSIQFAQSTNVNYTDIIKTSVLLNSVSKKASDFTNEDIIKSIRIAYLNPDALEMLKQSLYKNVTEAGNPNDITINSEGSENLEVYLPLPSSNNWISLSQSGLLPEDSLFHGLIIPLSDNNREIKISNSTSKVMPKYYLISIFTFIGIVIFCFVKKRK